MSRAVGATRGGVARRALLAVHRWTGLTLGLVLMSSGLSGALLVVAKPADRAWNAALHRAATPGLDAAAVDAVVQRIGAEHPKSERVVRLPRRPGDSLRVDVRGPWHGEIHVDPSSGRELGRRAEDAGFFNLVFEWHSSLLSEKRGKAFLAIAAAAGMATILAGIILWWPSPAIGWRRALRVQWRANVLRQVLDLHRVGGALAAVILVVSLGSGLYMAWRPVSTWVNALAGYRAVAAPAASSDRVAPVSRLIAAADRALPGGRVSIVVLPAAGDRPVRVRKQLADEVHPNGLSSVYLHPGTASVLRIERWNDGGPGLLGYQYIYPLHVGVLGGAAHRVLTALAGLFLFLLGASGVWLWWRRGRRIP